MKQQNIFGYLINLDKDKDRLKEFYEKNKDSHIFQRVSAVYGKDIPKINKLFDCNRANIFYNERVNILPNEIGCTLSHIEVYKKIIENDNIEENEFVLVAEDDAFFIDNWLDLVKKIICYIIDKNVLKLVSFTNYTIEDFNIKDKLWMRSYNEYEIPDTKINIFRLYESITLSSYFYIIRKSAARQVINNLQKEKPYWLADDFFEMLGGIEHVAFTNPVLAISNKKFESTIGKKREKNTKFYSLKLLLNKNKIKKFNENRKISIREDKNRIISTDKELFNDAKLVKQIILE